jgi:hypothetical protein
MRGALRRSALSQKRTTQRVRTNPDCGKHQTVFSKPTPLAGQAPDGFGRPAWTMPSEKFQLLALKRIRRPKELFKIVARMGRKFADILEIRFERRSVGHRKHPIVSLFLAFAFLFDFENADRATAEHDTRIGLRVMQDQHIQRIAILGFGRGNEAPILRISQTCHQRFRRGKNTKLGIEIELARAAPWRFDHGEDAVVVGPTR